MGEKKTRTERMKAQHPICCYCGHRPTETTDHCPPKIVFLNKDRPKGLEFPACEDCNKKSSTGDAVAALIFGLTVNINPELVEHKVSAIKRFKTVQICAPEVIQEVLYNRPNRTFEKREVSAVGLDPQKVKLFSVGPNTRRHLFNFSAKLTVAAYFNETQEICLPTTEILTHVSLNHQLLKHGLPELPILYEKISSLKQGIKDTTDQFSYAPVINREERVGHFKFQFNSNAIIHGFISEHGFSDDSKSEDFRRFGNLFI